MKTGLMGGIYMFHNDLTSERGLGTPEFDKNTNHILEETLKVTLMENVSRALPN